MAEAAARVSPGPPAERGKVLFLGTALRPCLRTVFGDEGAKKGCCDDPGLFRFVAGDPCAWFLVDTLVFDLDLERLSARFGPRVWSIRARV